MDFKLLNERYNKIGKQINDNELVILFANSMPKYPRFFLQDNNFFYFTGLQIPDAVLLIQKIKGKPVLHLFIERGIPEMEVWEGKKMIREEATKISGIKTVSFLDEFERKINFYFSISKKCYVNIGTGNIASSLSKRQEFAKKITEQFPHIQIEDTKGIITPLRTVKDKWEVHRSWNPKDIQRSKSRYDGI
jgi:Xaa-Pro aminopeptidase